MSSPELVPGGSPIGVVSTWAFGALAAIAIGVFVAVDQRFAWLAVALGGSLLVSFIAQLWSGRAHGFVLRVAAGVLGAMAAMGIISLGFVLASLVAL